LAGTMSEALLPSGATSVEEAKKKEERVDMDGHTGLRGVVSVYVVLFHCVLYSTLGWNWQGSAQMPIFFLLAGYSIAVVYGSKPLAGPCGRGGAPGEPEPAWKVSACAFWQNRCARIAPMYYLGQVLGVPLFFLGYGTVAPTLLNVIQTTLVTIFFVSSWGEVVTTYDGPAWTVSTLAFFWVVFPYLLPPLQRLSAETQVQTIAWMFWGHAVIVTLALIVLSIWFGGLAFFTATMNPVLQLPVFVMGVLGGLLRLRVAKDPDAAAAVPWPSLAPLPVCCTARVPRAQWPLITDLNALLLVLLTVGGSILQSFLKRYNIDFGGEIWFQCIFPMAQLTVIMGLTLDNGTSITSTILRNPVAKWLGDFSMELYLLHFHLIFYLCLALYGPIKWPDNLDDCDVIKNHAERGSCQHDTQAFNDKRVMPVWGIPVVLAVAIAVAYLIFRYITEPCRKLFRADAVIVPTEDKKQPEAAAQP
jgi:peptidoglycan/LPS O-acetylase OafA/YrhL